MSASFALLDSRGVLAVSGPDTRRFLQGLVSNDVERVGPTQGRYAPSFQQNVKVVHGRLDYAPPSTWLAQSDRPEATHAQ